MADVVWKDRKRIIFGLPWTFTRYSLTQDKLIIDTGFISRKEDEIRLYRILDITLERPLSQRIWGLGTIRLNTADKTSPEVSVKRIKHAKAVKEMLSDMVEKERDEKRITAREFMGYDDLNDMDDIEHGV
ncbi:MAG: PH domain-containing protein [Eubacteriales bacterium]